MSQSIDEHRCPLCHQDHTTLFFEDTQRRYLSCSDCGLVFVPERFWLNAEEEKSVYDLHENDAQDQGYRKFLSRLSTPLLDRLDAGQRGLDFGCGPGPTLSLLLEKEGHRMDLYDPFYYNDPSIFKKRYDFICATEVVEHLHHPGTVFRTLFKMVRPGGWLAIMTKLVIDARAFRQWHYIRDLTHVCFYNRRTFDYIARRFDASLECVDKDAILLQKRDPGTAAKVK